MLQDFFGPQFVARLGAMASDPVQDFAIAAVVAAMTLVVVSAFVKTMIPLRWLAVASGVAFVLYGALLPSIPTLLLNAVLLPINFYRAIEMMRLTRKIGRLTASHDLTGVWLKPYMHSAKVKAGTTLFGKGDTADRMYLLADGRVEFVEIGEVLGPGVIFGEIAFFTPERTRALSARCIEDCTVLSIDEVMVKRLYYENPALGFELIRLVAARLTADADRLRRQIALAEPAH